MDNDKIGKLKHKISEIERVLADNSGETITIASEIMEEALNAYCFALRAELQECGLTKREAKDIALEKLQWYYRLHLVYREIRFLPPELIAKIERLHNHCPLCELFCVPNPEDGKHCGGCPLTSPDCNNRSDEKLQANIKLIEAWECT